MSGRLVSGQGFRLAAAAITLVGLLLRLHRIGEPELWSDEAVSFQLATTPDVLDLLTREGNAPLYYLLLRAWTFVAGPGELALRLPSALVGTLLVVVVVGVGRGLFGRGVGLWSGLLAAVAPIHVYYSQETRTYALMTCLVAVLCGALWRALEVDEWRWWAVTAGSATAAILAHYFAALVIVAATPFVLAWGTRRQRQRYVLAMAAGGLPVVLWVALSMPHAAPQAAASFSASWLAEAWRRTPPLLAVPASLEVLGLGSQAGRVPIWLRRFDALQFPAGARWAVLATLGLLGVWVAMPWQEWRLPGGAIRRKVAYLFGLLLIPLLLLWGMSWVKPVYLVGRYDLVAFPAFVLLGGLSLDKLVRAGRGGPWLAAGAAAVLFAGLGLKLGLYFSMPGDRAPSSRLTATELTRVVEPGDTVVFTNIRGPAVVYYLDRLGYRWNGHRCTPPDGLRWFACTLLPRLFSPGTEAVDARRFLDEAAARRTATWLVLSSFGPEIGGANLVESLLVTDLDVRLVRALEGRGFEVTDVSAPLGIIRMQPP